MRDNWEKVIARLDRLQRDIERLKTGERGGVWSTWTPTITYGGGTTDPTETALTLSRYARIGNVIIVSIKTDLTRGTGDRDYTMFSLPVAPTIGYYDPAPAIEDYTTTTKATCSAFIYNSLLRVNHGAMARDGTLYITLIYEP